jgi:hypothetical protein
MALFCPGAAIPDGVGLAGRVLLATYGNTTELLPGHACCHFRVAVLQKFQTI